LGKKFYSVVAIAFARSLTSEVSETAHIPKMKSSLMCELFILGIWAIPLTSLVSDLAKAMATSLVSEPKSSPPSVSDGYELIVAKLKRQELARSRRRRIEKHYSILVRKWPESLEKIKRSEPLCGLNCHSTFFRSSIPLMREVERIDLLFSNLSSERSVEELPTILKDGLVDQAR
jgi:hypothetical protein